MVQSRRAASSARSEASNGSQGVEKKSSENKSTSSWLSEDPIVRWNERTFLLLAAFWVSVMAVVVGTGVYEHFCNWGYTSVGVIIGLPHLVVPVLFAPREEQHLPWHQRFGTKLNAYVAVFGYVGNFFWTHYFFNLLDAKYTFCHTWNMNGVPVFLWYIIQGYFLLYHTVSNMVIRKFTSYGSSQGSRIAIEVAVVLVLSYITALMEAITISGFPYYTIGNRAAFYTVGSAFYAIYFVVSFPTYYRLTPKHSLCGAARDGLAASMLVFIMLDWWRLFVGAITLVGDANTPPYGGY